MNFAMATLGLKEMGKFLWEGREKSLPSWLSQFSFAKLRQPTGQTFPWTLYSFFSKPENLKQLLVHVILLCIVAAAR